MKPGLRTWPIVIFWLSTILGAAFASLVNAAPCARPVVACPEIARLLAGREGYGRAATGGLDGEFATVTSNADDKGPGTLRTLLRGATGPLWIRFATDMDIDLKGEIPIPSNVTIDGRGRQVRLLNFGLEVQPGKRNVIATHLTIDGQFATKQTAFNVVGARDVWADHLDLSRFVNRLIDVKNGADNVTLSWIKFHDHNKVMLFNNTTDPNMFAFWDRDSTSHVTLHHCWFVDAVQRNPRARYGVYDVYNNLLENWDFYGMAFSLEARAHVDGNIFINSTNRPCVEPQEFDTIENVERNYCKGIPAAGSHTALANGEPDRAAYEKSMPLYHYTHDYRAFLQVADNLYLGDARPVLANFMADRVPPPLYCTTYRRPSEAMVDMIRNEAGNTPAEARAPTQCPSGAQPGK